MIFDLLIKNGRVVDGTGSPWYVADIGIAAGKIVAVSRSPISSEAKQSIDAAQKVVAPGFIDIHSHADLAILREPQCLGRLRQGVTTQVIGNCGLSAAPVNPKAIMLLKTPYEATLGSYSDWNWSGVDQYFERVGQNQIGTNIALLLGHATFRTVAMNGVSNRQPTSDELKAMQKLIAAGLEEGAFGITTGMIYPPSCYADTAELIVIAKAMAKKGGFYASHIRGEGLTLLPAIQEVITIAEQAGVPGHISHLKANSPKYWGKVNEALALIEDARRRGLDISCDQYPYVAGSGSLGAILPPWAQEGGVAAMLERLQKTAIRQRIKAEFEIEDLPGWDNYVKAAGWDNIIITWVKSERNKDIEGLSVAKIAALKGKEPWDAVGDLLIEENGVVQMVAFIMNENDVQTVMRYRGTMVGTDGIESGGKSHPRLYGTFPRILERYVRQLHILTLEDAVRKMSSLPAARLGLSDRGVIKKGLWADLVIFDPENIEERATYNDPLRHPAGIDYVIVNGGISIVRGESTGSYSGQILKRNNF
ncbi:MAG: N-acyl-D-amino-acid deacylase family protein [Bacteroidota bacterium]